MPIDLENDPLALRIKERTLLPPSDEKYLTKEQAATALRGYLSSKESTPTETTTQQDKPAPWYSERGVNERLAPVNPTTSSSFADRLLAPEMNASKQALRTVFGIASHPIDTLMTIPNMLKGGIDIVAGVPSEQSQMVGGELDRRGLGLDMSQTLGQRWSKAGKTLVEEPLTPAFDAAMAYGAKKGVDATKQWWLPKEQRATAPTPNYLESTISNTIRTGYEKGVRPTVVGKRSYGQIESAAAKAQAGVEAIIENKGNLKLTDRAGEVRPGLPTNLHEFTQAISQTKDILFKRFDELAKKAGAKGAVVETTSIANELSSLGKGKVQQTFAPETSQYIASRAQALKGQTFTPLEAQEAIKMLNSSLEAYYKNPSFDTYSRAAIDEFIVRRMRELTDNAITKLEGPGYEGLKKQYGSLSSIEKEVAHRTIVDARKAGKNIFDLSDVATAGELANLLLNPNPLSFAKATAYQAAKYRMKVLTDPNRNIKNMFKDAESLIAKRPPQKGSPIGLPTMSDVERSNAAVAAREAEPARAAAEQAAWKAKTQASDEAAAAATGRSAREVSKLSSEREPLRDKPTVEFDRAAAEQAKWKAAKDADDARTAIAVERSAREVKQAAKEREPLVVDKTFEGIPEGREIVLEGISERGKKFSYKENARAAYMESKEAIESLSNASGDLIEGEGSVMRTMNKNKVPPAVRVTVMKRIRAYITEGLGKEDAAISAIADTVAEFEKTRKEVVRQTGLVE